MNLKMKLFNGFNNMLCAVYDADTVVLFNCLAGIAIPILYCFTYFAGVRNKFDTALVMCGWLIFVLIVNAVFAIKHHIRKENKNEARK